MMDYTLSIVVTLLIVISHVYCKISLPDGVKQCHTSDANFRKCTVNNSKYLIPQMIPGDPAYHLPPFNPLKVPKIQVDNGQLNLVFKDLSLLGLEEVELTDFKLDTAQQEADLFLRIPSLKFIGEYDVNGRILVLPIQGSGPVNLTIVDLSYPIHVKYNLVPKKGKTYAMVDLHSSKFETSRVHISLEGLFGGKKELNDNMNEVLNQNWREVINEVGPALNDGIREVFIQIFNRVLQRISFDDLFPV